MKKITKKDFMILHKSKLRLVGSFDKSKEVTQEIIKDYKKNNDILPSIEVSRVDIDNQGDYIKINIYQNENIIFVESIIDNFKCRTCSWNNMEVNTTVYIVK